MAIRQWHEAVCAGCCQASQDDPKRTLPRAQASQENRLCAFSHRRLCYCGRRESAEVCVSAVSETGDWPTNVRAAAAPGRNFDCGCCMLPLPRALESPRYRYLHCWGGHGRTGTVLSLMLGLLYNIGPDEAMGWVQLLHDVRQAPCGVASPQTPGQRLQVRRIMATIARKQEAMAARAAVPMLASQEAAAAPELEAGKSQLAAAKAHHHHHHPHHHHHQPHYHHQHQHQHQQAGQRQQIERDPSDYMCHATQTSLASSVANPVPENPSRTVTRDPVGSVTTAEAARMRAANRATRREHAAQPPPPQAAAAALAGEAQPSGWSSGYSRRGLASGPAAGQPSSLGVQSCAAPATHAAVQPGAGQAKPPRAVHPASSALTGATQGEHKDSMLAHATPGHSVDLSKAPRDNGRSAASLPNPATGATTTPQPAPGSASAGALAAMDASKAQLAKNASHVSCESIDSDALFQVPMLALAGVQPTQGPAAAASTGSTTSGPAATATARAVLAGDHASAKLAHQPHHSGASTARTARSRPAMPDAQRGSLPWQGGVTGTSVVGTPASTTARGVGALAAWAAAPTYVRAAAPVAGTASSGTTTSCHTEPQPTSSLSACAGEEDSVASTLAKVRLRQAAGAPVAAMPTKPRPGAMYQRGGRRFKPAATDSDSSLSSPARSTAASQSTAKQPSPPTGDADAQSRSIAARLYYKQIDRQAASLQADSPGRQTDKDTAAHPTRRKAVRRPKQSPAQHTVPSRRVKGRRAARRPAVAAGSAVDDSKSVASGSKTVKRRRRVAARSRSTSRGKPSKRGNVGSAAPLRTDAMEDAAKHSYSPAGLPLASRPDSSAAGPPAAAPLKTIAELSSAAD